jgi:hypothetical protein
MRCLVIACALFGPATGHANGRPPATNGVRFKPGDNRAIYVASTFGVLVSPDGCHFYWLCEDNVGFGGGFDPGYAISGTGAIFATTFHGLRVSRDGGCSFKTATSELPANDPNNLTLRYVDAVEIGPTGEVCIGLADTALSNAVYCSNDDGLTFTMRGALPATMYYTSIAIAPSDPMRIYVTAFQVFGDTTPPSAHFFGSVDGGNTWVEQPLTNVVLGSSPNILLSSVDAANADIVFVRSVSANPPSGDRLYRSIDGGATFVEVLSLTTHVAGLVIRDAQTVIVASQTGGYRSIDRGTTFAPLVDAPQLACLGQRGDGTLFGCAANYDPDHMALATSLDGASWHPVLEFAYISGPLSCPSGTAEHDTCDDLQYRSLAQQLGIQPSQPSQCSAGPDGLVDGPVTLPHKSGGCCDGGAIDSSVLGFVTVGLLLALRLPKRRSTRSQPSRRCVSASSSRIRRAI